MTTQLARRIDRIEARRRPAALTIDRVVIGPDEPRRPGEILLGGWPAGDPAQRGVTLILRYVGGEVTNPSPADVVTP